MCHSLTRRALLKQEGQSIAAFQFGEAEAPNRQTKLDKLQGDRHNKKMEQATEQDLKAYRKASAARRREFKKDPEKTKQFLIDAGILERCKTAKHGVRLAKFYRSTKAN